MRSTGKLAAEADRLRARVEALERLAAESRLAEETREQEARTRSHVDTPREPLVATLGGLVALARRALSPSAR